MRGETHGSLQVSEFSAPDGNELRTTEISRLEETGHKLQDLLINLGDSPQDKVVQRLVMAAINATHGHGQEGVFTQNVRTQVSEALKILDQLHPQNAEE